MSVQKSVVFGRTGQMVCRIGISASYGLDGDGVEEAVDHGVNYIYWGSLRKGSFGNGLKKVLARNRSDVMVVLQTYWRVFRGLQTWDIERGLRALGLDYCDVMLMGWFNGLPATHLIEDAMKLKEAGKVRFLALSTHERSAVPSMAEHGAFDIFHVRYNAAHRGAEQDIFPHVDPVTGPGLVAFTATRWGHLLNPRKMPRGERPLSACDAYRFCLSSPHIHTIATGPANREHLRESLKALELGPLDPEEMARIRRIGDYVHGEKTTHHNNTG